MLGETDEKVVCEAEPNLQGGIDFDSTSEVAGDGVPTGKSLGEIRDGEVSEAFSLDDEEDDSTTDFERWQRDMADLILGAHGGEREAVWNVMERVLAGLSREVRMERLQKGTKTFIIRGEKRCLPLNMLPTKQAVMFAILEVESVVKRCLAQVFPDLVVAGEPEGEGWREPLIASTKFFLFSSCREIEERHKDLKKLAEILDFCFQPHEVIDLVIALLVYSLRSQGKSESNFNLDLDSLDLEGKKALKEDLMRVLGHSLDLSEGVSPVGTKTLLSLPGQKLMGVDTRTHPHLELVKKVLGEAFVDGVIADIKYTGMDDDLTEVEKRALALPKDACDMTGVAAEAVTLAEQMIRKRGRGAKSEVAEVAVAGESEHKGTPGLNLLRSVGVEDILDRTAELIEFNEKLQRSFELAIKRVLRDADRIVVAGMMREALVTFAGIDEVSDFEYWWRLFDYHTELENNPHILSIKFGSPESLEVHKLKLESARQFLEKNEMPSKLRKLVEVIDCAGLQAGLNRVRAYTDPYMLEAEENRVLQTVLAEVYKYVHRRGDASESQPGYVLGMPVNVIDKKDSSCFSLPWLTASMLILSGIPIEKLFYCQQDEMHDGTIGGHAGLVLYTSGGRLLFVDPMWKVVVPFKAGCFFNDEDGVDKFNDLFLGKNREPIIATCWDADFLELPIFAEFMSLDDGLASIHLLHVGITFLNEGRVEEARAAFEMGLGFNSKSPDLLYHLGVVYFREGDEEMAQDLWEKAVEIFPRCMIAHFALGKLALKDGKFHEAKAFFQIVADAANKIYGDYDYVKEAVKYVAS